MSGDTDLGDEAVGDVIEEHVLRFPTREAAEKARSLLDFVKREGALHIYDACGAPIMLRLQIDGTMRWGEAPFGVQFRNFAYVEIVDSPDLAARRFARVDTCPCTHCAHLRASGGES